MTAATLPQSTPIRPSTSRIGAIVGGYRVEARVGAGVTSVVYRAQDLEWGRTVALKVLRPEFAARAGHLRSFFREANLVARLDDDRIVQIYGSGQDGDRAWIAMEHVPGGTLRDLVGERGKLDPEQLVGVALEISKALAYLAENGIVHRDIKPANVLFTLDGRVKLTDFGVALDCTSADPAGAHGVGAGTRRYMAPEQMTSVEIDGRADLYSLGAVLFYAITGAAPLPFDPNGTSKVDIDFGWASSHPLTLLIRRMLAANPDDRFTSARELVALLETRHFTALPERLVAA